MRIAVFMDGTWDAQAADTNVSQLYSRALQTAPESGSGQATHYVKGVGTGPWDRLEGGVLGVGVNHNIREGYDFIAERHKPGDQIFLIGFSRGAFTARSLAGMIAKCGIVSPEYLGGNEAFDRYRDLDRPGLREMIAGEEHPRTAQDHTVLEHSRLERIRFIGVFDTVGSLGIPGGLGQLVSRHEYEFHDTHLSGYVDIARHAVAIDENRPEFEPTLWTAVPIPIRGYHTSVEQRWFVGSHSDVGGGGIVSREPAPLSALAREWIAKEAVSAGLVIDPGRTALTNTEWQSPIHDSYREFISGLAELVPGRKRYWRPVNTTIGERLNESVLRRWNADTDPPYRPRNPNLAPWVTRENEAAGK